MQIPNAVFETERLIARPWTLQDAEAAFEIYGDPEVVKGLNRAPVENLAEQRERLSAVLANNEQWAGRYGYWAAALRDTGEVIGAVILKPLPNSEWIEVGWHLARRHWGKGYATEAGRGALRYGAEQLGLTRVYAIALPWNVNSTAVMDRIGMRFVGLTREFHDLELALSIADRVTVLSQGAVLASGAPEHIKEHAAVREVPIRVSARIGTGDGGSARAVGCIAVLDGCVVRIERADDAKGPGRGGIQVEPVAALAGKAGGAVRSDRCACKMGHC